MTSPFPGSPSTPSLPSPPARCPAHAQGAGGLRRLYGPEAERAPHELYERLRQEHGPVAPVLLPGEISAWLVLGHQENLEVLRNPLLFSADSRRWNVRLAPDSPLLPITAYQPVIAFADGDEHARLRSAVTDSLARINRHGNRRYVVRYTDRLLHAFAAAGQADLVTDFAEKLPILVLSRQFGIPEQDALPLGEAVRDLVRPTETAVKSNQIVVETMEELIRRKKAVPGDDLTSWLLRHEAGLSDDEVLQHLRHALVAANENTANLVANTLRMVLTDRRFRGNLAGGQMTLPDALDQVMWDQPPLSLIPNRWATGDTVLGGQRINGGDMVLLGLAAGNRDPAVRPDLSTPVHGNRSHLAFGKGPHECPGMDIGRAIADTAIDTLLARLPDIQLAVPETELSVTTSMVSSRLNTLPVRFTPQRPKQGAPAGAQPQPRVEPGGTAAMAATPAEAPDRGSWRKRILPR
ncbi:cytochrome P450 [Streptomyces chrestomyceticus]|uniref:cytochrome P450 n=1 Tax=Streptomyces chrestomyceticus TaxID=68185 RepID=UPI0037ADC7ED